MTGSDSALDAVAAEPSRLNEHAGELHAMLDAGEDEQRRAVAELLRDTAQSAPSVVADHTGLLDTALHDDDPEVRRFGAVATADVCNTTPEAVTGLVEALVDAYPTFEYEIERTAVIRTLSLIGNETDMSLDQYDSLFAELLRNGEGIVPSEVAENVGGFVIDVAQKYPETVRALIDVLDNPDTKAQRNAMMTVALIAREDIAALPDPEQVLDEMTELRSHRNIDTENVNKAVGMIRSAMDESKSTE